MSARARDGRLWEIDAARTVAIAIMVVYHAGYDVDRLGPSVDVDSLSGGWRALQIATGSSFLFLVGVSLAVSNARGRARGLSGWELYRRHARRAAIVLGAALLVTLATLVALGPDEYVRFGILHCIGAAMLIGPLLVRLGPVNAALALAVLIVGMMLLRSDPSDAPGLMVLGVRSPEGAGVDWYPLLPWLAPVLAGLAAGKGLYPDGSRGSWGRWLPTPRWARAAGWPGRHALPIYLVHQLVLIPLVAAGLALAGVTVDWGGL
ncbi:MAG: heparan-alpha-glucosaminide N-acetyltransferase [Thermoleophilia bacterium]